MIKMVKLPEKHIFVCENHRPDDSGRPSCGARGGKQIRAELKHKLAELGLHKTYRVNRAGCLGQCEHGPNLVIYPQGIWYAGVQPDDVDAIIEESILNDKVIERLQLKETVEEPQTMSEDR